MVKYLLHLWTALTILSCGGAPYMAGGRMDRDARGSGDHDMLEQTIDDPAAAQDDFNDLERLAENPVDPRGASLDALLLIPGFPEKLARSVVAVAGGKGSGGNWVALLTPQEREDLYRYRDYLVLPSPHPLHASCRVTADDVSEKGGGRREEHIVSTMGGWKALWRERRTVTGGGTAYYLSGSVFDGAMRFHGGTFVPDFGLGLVFGGAHRSYVFSGAYPFHNPRGIAGSTSFYSTTVLGLAAEIRYGKVRGVFFGGRPREYRSDRFEVAEEIVRGGRLEVQGGDATMGLSCSTGVSGGKGCICAADGRWESNRSILGFELAFAGKGEPALLSAFSYRAGGARTALFLYAVPPGVSGMFTGVNGKTADASTGVYGATVVAEREILPKLHARAAIDRCSRREGFDEKEDRDLRAECEKRWSRIVGKVAWATKADDCLDAVPYPGPQNDRHRISHSLGLVSDIRLARRTSLKLTLRRMWVKDGGGFLACPFMRVGLFSGRLDASALFACYRNLAGGAVCYFYEPSLEGSYPWRSASNDIERGSFIIGCNIKRLRVSTHVALEVGKPPECSLQAAWDF
ncbi:MAG: hypothetical protein PHD74_01065 [Candidatus Krumholzibacteria bacterium]|nr:hypothetical protein [Candidatus Krumholzibacteria bacterium]